MLVTILCKIDTLDKLLRHLDVTQVTGDIAFVFEESCTIA